MLAAAALRPALACFLLLPSRTIDCGANTAAAEETVQQQADVPIIVNYKYFFHKHLISHSNWFGVFY